MPHQAIEASREGLIASSIEAFPHSTNLAACATWSWRTKSYPAMRYLIFFSSMRYRPHSIIVLNCA
jgi:hypothetical protein